MKRTFENEFGFEKKNKSHWEMKKKNDFNDWKPNKLK